MLDAFAGREGRPSTLLPTSALHTSWLSSSSPPMRGLLPRVFCTSLPLKRRGSSALCRFRECELAASAFRHLRGFDCVTVYKLLGEGAAEVLAEDKREDLAHS